MIVVPPESIWCDFIWARPLAARIMYICDIYDALRSKRPYKTALDHLTVVDIITRGDGRTQPEHFDPAIFAVFEKHHQMFRDIFETTSQNTPARRFL